MKTFDFKDQWGNVTRVSLVRGAYADGSLAVQMLCEREGYWEPFAALTVNLCDRRNQNGSFAYVDANNLPTAPDFLASPTVIVALVVVGFATLLAGRRIE